MAEDREFVTPSGEPYNPWGESEPKTVLDEGANPEQVNAQVAAVLGDSFVNPAPEMDVPPDTFVQTPGGHSVEVKELTGEDEEAIAKIRFSANADPLKYLNALLERGVVSIDGAPATPHVLRQLLTGDREYLLLAIRKATFGDDVEIEDYYCQFCDDTFDVEIDLNGIPVTPLDSEVFDVPLWKGGKATVRLMNGEDQEKVLQHTKLTGSEQNTILLSRCVLTIEDKDGKAVAVDGSTKTVNRLGARDRQEILKQMGERQPGPRYDEVKMLHEDCGKELQVPLTVVEMFRGL